MLYRGVRHSSLRDYRVGSFLLLTGHSRSMRLGSSERPRGFIEGRLLSTQLSDEVTRAPKSRRSDVIVPSNTQGLFTPGLQAFPLQIRYSQGCVEVKEVSATYDDISRQDGTTPFHTSDNSIQYNPARCSFLQIMMECTHG